MLARSFRNQGSTLVRVKFQKERSHMSSSTAFGSGHVDKDASSSIKTEHQAQGDTGLLEMRDDLSKLAGVVARVAENRVNRTQIRAQIAMRENPWATVGIAAAAGCLAAILIAPRSGSSSSRRNRHQNFNFSDLGRHMQMPSLPHFSMPSMPNVDTRPITSRLEQVVDQVSRMDAQAAGPIIEKVKDWVDAVMSRIRK